MTHINDNDKEREGKSIITSELISKFVQGKTSLDEWVTVMAAIKKYPWVKKIVDVSININRSFIKKLILQNPSCLPVSKLYSMHLRKLPVMRLAANSEANDCVVKCEAFVLSKFGKVSQYNRLCREACYHDWLQKGGTPLYNIGRLLELAQLSVSRRFRGTLEEMQGELNGKCSVIVAMNANRLANPKSRASAACDHAVVVTEINQDEGYVELYDPQSGNQADRYPVETFLRAWKPSKNFFVSIIERGVRPYTPHPEYVAHIKLPEDIMPIADMLAENAHDIWAIKRLADGNYDPSYMKPFCELNKKQRNMDYPTALNTIKLLYKLGFTITKNETSEFVFQSNKRDAEGKYVPNPINVDDVVLPKEVENLTEYIAENAHEEWARGKFKEGWVYGPKRDKEKKQSFDLIPYCELLDSEKEYDRKMAMNTLRVLYKLGYKIIKQ